MWIIETFRPPVANSEYDQYPEGLRYENEREIQSSIPYGVQNVYDASAGRPTRSKNRHKVNIKIFIKKLEKIF